MTGPLCPLELTLIADETSARDTMAALRVATVIIFMVNDWRKKSWEEEGELKKKDKDNFTMTTIEDLQQAIGQLQKKQLTERRMQNMTRLKRFVEAIEQYGKVVEIFCNSSEFVAFVWVSF